MTVPPKLKFFKFKLNLKVEVAFGTKQRKRGLISLSYMAMNNNRVTLFMAAACNINWP